MKVFALVVALCVSDSVLADNSCSTLSLKNYFNLLLEGPEKKQFELKGKIPQTSIEVAKQRPNPQLNFEYMKGDELGLDLNSYNLSVQHIIELGNKRRNRIDYAKTETLISEKNIELSLYQYYVSQLKKF